MTFYLRSAGRHALPLACNTGLGSRTLLFIELIESHMFCNVFQCPHTQ